MAKSLSNRKTKIVATIGPASWDKEQLADLIRSGMNVARLNFSHGDLERHAQTVKNIREVAEELEAPVAILQDLQGPKIRLNNFEGERVLERGDKIVVTSPGSEGGDKFVVDIEDLHKYVEEGQSLFIDDGIIEIKVEKKEGRDLHCVVLHGGVARPRKGVNLPDANLPVSSMTEKDQEDLKKGISLKFDYVALSFVREADDILKLKKLLKEYGSEARVVAKIEKKEAIENIADIVLASDAIMIARGDLAVEIGQVHLPAVQKKITKLCNQKGKPVITATQMLDSMQNNSRPTRAEITDVANAVLDGSDALMLSGESAFGQYPVRSVETMHEIISEVEKQPGIYYKFKNRKMDTFTVPESIAISTVLCSRQLKAKTIVCMSTTGRTVRMISKYRPKAQLVAVTYKSETLTPLELCWGVQTLMIDQYDNTEAAFEQIEAVLLENNIVQPGDHVVLTLGLPVKQGQKTNSVRVFTIGEKS
ncbi:MAG: pyruvate kinase, partial [Bdellovibrionales bacterium]|nr:pyruvate kinase [Bdellovibrionales bacterium]NQZ18993.1 pyruvate kinase [Bdellovibrionales bacterium]